MSETRNTRLYVMVLAFTLVFPVLGFTFTTFPDTVGDYDITIDANQLMLAGITLTEAESHDLTWTGAFQYFNISGKSYRTQWKAGWRDPWLTPLGDGICLEQPGIFGYWDPDKLVFKSWETGNTFKLLTNATLVNEYNTDYNWTRLNTVSGLVVLVTPYTRGVSMNQAVYVDAHLNFTMGTALDETSNFNFRQFTNWYFSLLVGDTTYGLPSVFSWVVRIISGISVLSAILLAKDLISL